jgi:hypothetical protein
MKNICEKHRKFAAYHKEIGEPKLEVKKISEGEAEFRPVAGCPMWHETVDYRISCDRHWELRLKWVNSDKTLPIERFFNGRWHLFIGEDIEFSQHSEYREYREALREGDSLSEMQVYTDDHAGEKPAKEKDPGAHYRYEYKVKLKPEDIERGFVVVKLDPFRIASIYRMTDFALKTVLKKCLCAGNRGHKDFRQDLKDIINAAERRIEMLSEDFDDR